MRLACSIPAAANDWSLLNLGWIELRDIAARKEEAKQLTAPIANGGKGLSKRQAAKVLGVHHSTIQDDLAEKPPKSGGKTATAAIVIKVLLISVSFSPLAVSAWCRGLHHLRR